jgi:hypothetical protein
VRLHRRLPTLLAGLVAASAAACDSSREAETLPGPNAVEVNSSLAGVSVLPGRLHWSVTTSLPADEVREVRFTIDGRRYWTDYEPPFSYGEEGGYFVTTWLSPGRHRFSANVFDVRGDKWSDIAFANVSEAHVPTSLLSVWWRLSDGELETPTPPGNPPEANGWLWFNNGSLWLHAGHATDFSSEPGFAYGLSADRPTLRVSTPIFIGSERFAGAVGGWSVLGYQCAPDGPPATYVWSWKKGRMTGRFDGEPVYTTYLVLRARAEPCEQRRRLIEGTWENAG